MCNLVFQYIAVNKVEALKRYKFSLAFENSNEEDYVTEKFFQSLVAGINPDYINYFRSIYMNSIDCLKNVSFLLLA